jgi:adenylosuccinate lyase
VPIGHLLISLNSLLKGLNKLELNVEMINQNDLEENWAVVAEGIQNILRRVGYPKPYEALKALTQTNEKITAGTISDFIDGLSVDDNIKKELKAIAHLIIPGAKSYAQSLLFKQSIIP